ncbi:ATP-binding protein [Chitinibacter sp. ZOR0017]|uniref:ATP-binding protein n=1 Tax=Chitinibacter sp. ZOR0017 TaxID=1339254 RepID=UPI0006898A2A|nr:ATP-binding protein [Chitinibacter sp. ZOR0017]
MSKLRTGIARLRQAIRQHLGQSLSNRLTWFTGLATLGVWAVLLVVFFFVARHGFAELLEDRLRATGEMLIELHQNGQLNSRQELAAAERMSYALYSTDGQLISSNDPHPFTLSETGRRGHLHALRHDGHHWVSIRVERAGVQLVLAERSEWQEELFEELMEHLGWPLLVAALGLLLMLQWASRRALQPLAALSQELARREPMDLSPLATPAPQEIATLVNNLNQQYASIGTAIEREQRFTADAAHELRTPLAALRIQLELASSSPREQTRHNALGKALLGVDRATHLVNQLLALSRLDRLQQQDCQPQPLAPLIWAAWHEVAPDAPASDLQIHELAPFAPAVDASLLQLLLRNVFENALRYGQPPSVVTLTQHGLSISDHGQGVDETVLARLGERFFRPPGQAQSGSGLGLSIVRRIAELHGAELKLSHSASGGLCIELIWPAPRLSAGGV